MTKDKIRNMQRVVPTIGGDPEGFCYTQDGKLVSADAGILPMQHEEKEAPDRSFADGVQFELNFAAGTCREYLNQRLNSAINHLKNHIQPHGLHPVAVSSVPVTQQLINHAGPLAKVSGCKPDFSAYSKYANPPFQNFEEHPFRWAGFHLQFGLPIGDDDDAKLLAKVMDRTAGLFSTWLDTDDTCIQRRKDGIGLAGCYRASKDRFEYRTPGSYWLRSPVLTSMIYGVARIGVMIFANRMSDDFLAMMKDAEVRAAINNCDRKEAKRLFDIVSPILTDIANINDNQTCMSTVVQTYCKPNCLEQCEPRGCRHKYRLVPKAAMDWYISHNNPSELMEEWNGGLGGLLSNAVYGSRIVLDPNFLKFQEGYAAA